MKKGREISWGILAISFGAVFLISLFGSLSTTGSIENGWYDSVRPGIAPPDWVFGPVWTILYVLIAIAFYLALVGSNNKWKIGVIYGVNLVLNGLWSYVFFGLQNPSGAFAILAGIWLTIIGMMWFSWKIDRRSTYLLIPYLLWVSFAGVLNYIIAF